ncbi:hypothetical protein A4H97_15560 [Niastella yeongjuensis]|uniref:Uncharacterized protein n=1 Tax=Niastella yeongjuensis TaxID=354355 RepID=A0A1V9E522_9BACT|nr:oligosaccharide flippase family protein [Niastella yeongjuensis]OQP41015.1 hypothetical protein A4H97_15560 [Niastella yeongjuensis]SEO94820.1 Membrane protein involved in the export of O-antigen and teichoic acid [Niastella yeongjuensis]
MSNLKKNLSYIYILSLSQLLFPLISIPYISRVLAPEGIGQVGFIDSLTCYFITFAEFGIVTYGIREIAKHRNDPVFLKKLSAELLVLHMITSAVVLVVYVPVVFLLWHKIGDVRLLLFSLSFFVASFFSCEWYFAGLERFRFVAIRNLVCRVLGLISIFVLVTKPTDYYIYYGIITASTIATLLWNTITLLKEQPLSFKQVNWKQHLRPLFVVFQVAILFSATLWLDNILLGFLGGAVALGYYTFAARVIRITSALLTDSMWVLFPRMVSLLQHESQERFATTNLQSIRLFTTLAIPLSVGLFLLAEPFTALYFGPAFNRVYIDIKMLSLYPFIKGYSVYLTKQMLQPFGHDKLVVKGLLTGFIVLVISMLVLCPLWQDMGACLSLLLSEIVVVVYFTWWLRKQYAHMQLFDFTTLLQAAGTSLVFIPIVYFTKRIGIHTLPQFFVMVMGCILVYFVVQLVICRNKLLLQVYQSGLKIIGISKNV